MLDVTTAAVPIPEAAPEGFDPTSPFVCLRIRVLAANDVVNFEYEKPVEKPDLEGALEHMMGHPVIDPPRVENPLDIGCQHPRWLMIGFPAQGNMLFSGTAPGIRLKRRSVGQYGHLRHVDAAGNEGFAPRPNCRILYFAALPPVPAGTHYSDPFDLLVEVLQHGVDERGGPRVRRLPIVLDPDIKYPGPND